MHEMARVIAEEEPARPSEMVTTSEPGSGRDPVQLTPDVVSAVREGDPNRLRKRLAGDLDSIVLMALRKEPGQRYGSVESFADDLRRHLEQRPINAREASPWERFNRFRRRNPSGFAAGVLIAIVAFAGTVAVTLQARHDLRAAAVNPGIDPFLTPFWLFSSGIALAILCATVFFTRAGKAIRLGASAGGLIWGLGMMGRWRLENNLGWWRSQVAANADPFMILSPWTGLLLSLIGAALLLILSAIGRRFGWKGQALLLMALALGLPMRERIWFGEFIPALIYQPGAIPILGSAGMLLASGAIALLIMRLIAGPASSNREPK